MGQILTQQEIDALLSAIDKGEIHIPRSMDKARKEKGFIPYNFKKPNRVAKDQMRTLQMIHDSFSKLFSSTLSTYLRTIVEVSLEAVEQITYGEFLMSIPLPSCISIFSMEPLQGNGMIEIHPHLINSMIDRLLGGPGKVIPKIREFTEIEKALIEKVTIKALIDLQQVWQHVGFFSFRLLNLETNPQFVQITSPNEIVLIITFNLKAGEVGGVVSICFPYLMLEPMMTRLNAQQWFSSTQQKQMNYSSDAIKSEILKTRLILRTFLGKREITIKELIDLNTGDVIRLDTGIESSVSVEVEGICKFLAKPGLYKNKKAIKIQRILEKGEGINEGRFHPGTLKISFR